MYECSEIEQKQINASKYQLFPRAAQMARLRQNLQLVNPRRDEHLT